MMIIWIFIHMFLTASKAAEIELLECEPPDFPLWGGYGPRQDFYVPGDVIHYYCDAETHIGGNFYRRCEDTGDWSGETPVCDAPSAFSSTRQTSTADEQGESRLAVDGIRTTCTSTKGGEKEEWFGNFTAPGHLIRVMLFLPKGPVSYEVVLVRANGSEMVCGSQTANIDRYEWTFHNCPGPHNTGATGLKIRSLSTAPLQICEIQAFVLTSPMCTDPHLRIESGRVRLTRKTAILVCDSGYTRSPDNRLDCIRDGVWNRKPLYCLERQWELGEQEGGQSENSRPNNEPRQENPDRERLEV